MYKLYRGVPHGAPTHMEIIRKKRENLVSKLTIHEIILHPNKIIEQS
jgi:hypothetical protein